MNVSEFYQDALDTGQFDLAAIQKNIENSRNVNSTRVKALETAEAKRAENATWWRRHFVTVISTIAAAIVISLLAAIVTLAIAGARQSVPIIQPR